MRQTAMTFHGRFNAMTENQNQTPPAVTAVVVTYQSERTIGDAMKSLRRGYEAGLLHCIVVDNHSTDETLQILDTHRSWADIVAHPVNIGFGRGCNLGFERVKTDYVLFVNPDAMVEPEAVARLEYFIRNTPRAGLIAPAITEPNGSVQGVGNLPTPGRILAQAAPLLRPALRRPVHPGEQPFKTDWVCGAVLMGRVGLLRELGAFDPRFFLYYEETDLCRRVLRAGAEIWVVGEAVAHHIGAASSEDRLDERFEDCIAEYFFQSRFYYLRKHYGYTIAAATEISEIVLLFLRSVWGRLRGHKSRILKARLRGPILQLPPAIS
jgi:GT2 family glycosyltransferase